jgi:hypothetical protein
MNQKKKKLMLVGIYVLVAESQNIEIPEHWQTIKSTENNDTEN